MTKANSTPAPSPRTGQKPAKPSADFPLFAHNNGRWAKKVKGKIHYFGLWSDPQAALERWLAAKDDLLAERVSNELTPVLTPAPATKKRTAKKPKKPHKDFPLFAHATKRWAKKVRGTLHYFGPWDEPQKALEKWLAEKDDLLAGRKPRDKAKEEGVKLRDLCNQFLATKAGLRDAGELSPHTWVSYHGVCEQLIDALGRDRLLTDLQPDDFEKLRTKWAKTWGPVRIGSEINRARVVFNYAYKNGLIDKPMRFGEGFKRPSKKVLRLNRAAQGPKMFEAAELRRMLDKATQPLRSMILLGVNAGLGNNDVALLPINAADLDAGWLSYPRPKTGIDRRCPLWPETIEALREWLKERPQPKDDADAGLLFLTVRGNGWAKNTADRAITHECRKLLDALKIDGNRDFYALRHTFETIGGEARDQVAVDAIMGHVDDSMAGNYRERIGDDRLLAVSNHVRGWLFSAAAK